MVQQLQKAIGGLDARIRRIEESLELPPIEEA
jgi:ATP-dependent 26S proteasome regulatory subunit